MAVGLLDAAPHQTASFGTGFLANSTTRNHPVKQAS